MKLTQRGKNLRDAFTCILMVVLLGAAMAVPFVAWWLG